MRARGAGTTGRTKTLAAPPRETPSGLPHARVGSVPIFDGGPDEALAYCVDAMKERRGARVATANLDFLAIARRDGGLARLLRRSHLVVADGAPVVWLARLVGAGRVRRVPGVDFVGQLCEAGAARGGLRIALYGGTPEVAARAGARIADRYPGATIVEQISPPFRALTAEEQAEERERIAAADPELVLVALGCPKQEQLIARYFNAAPGALWIGIGGTLDFYAGRTRRAPRWIQAVGLEWAMRLAQEPRRLWRRYLLHDIPTLVRVAPACLRLRLGGRNTPPRGPAEAAP
jgi:N-acetylglucosaminyldiphosphoundecaprenol N-acetyl-beta-D-mannosaminyltransferase